MGPLRVLLITPANSYRVAAYIQAADLLGIQLLIASEGQYSLIPAIASGIQIKLSDQDQAFHTIINALADTVVHAVFSPDDDTSVLAAKVATQLKLPYNSPFANNLTRRKDLARQKLAQTDILTPKFCLLNTSKPDKQQLVQIGFPLVLKPVAMSASRGVIRVNNWHEFEVALARIKKILAAATHSVQDEIEKNQVLAEQYIPGKEYAMEGMLSAGQLEILTVFLKPDPLHGPFFEETYYITPSDLKSQQIEQVRDIFQQMCAVYGLQQGPIHAEFRVNQHGVWPLELAARTIGGQCAKIIEFQLNQSLESIVLANLVGLARNYKKAAPTAAGVLMIPIPKPGILRRVEGIHAASQVRFIEHVEITINTGYELIPVPEGSSYLGFIFAKAPQPDQVENALRRAHSCLKIVISPILNVISK